MCVITPAPIVVTTAGAMVVVSIVIATPTPSPSFLTPASFPPMTATVFVTVSTGVMSIHSTPFFVKIGIMSM